MKPDRIDRPEARRLAEEEFQRFAKLAAELTPDEWTLPTDCSAWDVRKIALHVLGSADAQASVREFAHQLRGGLPLNKQIDSHHWVDGLNELQIRERARLSDAELVGQLKEAGPKAVRGLRRAPVDAVPAVPRSASSRSSTSSTWDSPATSGAIASTSARRPAGRWSPRQMMTACLVADIVAEWAAIHGQPFDLGAGRPGRRDLPR